MSFIAMKLLKQYCLLLSSFLSSLCGFHCTSPTSSFSLSLPLSAITLCNKKPGLGTHVHVNSWYTEIHMDTHTNAQADLPSFCRLRLAHLDSHSMLGAFLKHNQNRQKQCIHVDTHILYSAVYRHKNIYMAVSKHINAEADIVTHILSLRLKQSIYFW